MTSSRQRLDERRHDIEDDITELDEVRAPSPIDARYDSQEPHLEDAVGQTESPDGKASSHSSRHVSRGFRTRYVDTAYELSFLIFFAILGTLARVGLTALTIYPGAPVTFGVLWSNMAGCLIMGFLIESRPLFFGHDECNGRVKREAESAAETIMSSSAAPNQEHGDTSAQSSQGNTKSRPVPFKPLASAPALYVGLTTGFCGSFTSFSSFIRDAFFALANALPAPIYHSGNESMDNIHRNGGYSFMALLAVLLTTIGLSLIAFRFGAQLALPCQSRVSLLNWTSGRFFVPVVIAFGWTCWLGAIIMSIVPPDRPHGSPVHHTAADAESSTSGSVRNTMTTNDTWRGQILFALVFAPLGCFIRFYASMHLNGKMKTFLLGTFMVNILGSALMALFLDLQRIPIGDRLSCQILQGLMDGFCGCLTTVSTWIVELSSLRRRHAYVYGLCSVSVALALFIIIAGSVVWTHGYEQAQCIT